MAGFRISVDERAPRDFLALVESLAFGRGRARYRRANVGAQLARFAAPRFVTARAEGVAVGCYAVDFRELRVDGRAVPGAYRGLLGVAEGARRQGVGRLLVERAGALIDERSRALATPVFAWGCIDAANAASTSLLERSGATDVGGLASWLVYRQFPRARRSLSIIDDGSGTSGAEDVPDVSNAPRVSRTQGMSSTSPVRRYRAAALRASHDCGLLDVTGLRPGALAGASAVASAGDERANDPRVFADLDDRGELRAAARVAETVLSFDTLGPLNDALVRWLVTPFPFARRRFDREAFRYLRLTDIALAADGATTAAGARHWQAFVSSLLAHHGLHYAMVILDPSSALSGVLRRAAGKRDALPAEIRVLARWHGAGDVAARTKRPATTAPLGLFPVDP